jgi:hypothetical protein
MANGERIIVGTQVAINKGPNRPYTVLETYKKELLYQTV